MGPTSRYSSLDRASQSVVIKPPLGPFSILSTSSKIGSALMSPDMKRISLGNNVDNEVSHSVLLDRGKSRARIFLVLGPP